MKKLYFLIGAPGVGKSSWIEKQSELIFGDESSDRLMNHVLSPDNLRQMVACPVMYSSGRVGISNKNEKFVWSILNKILDIKANQGELIIVDATHSRTKNISVYKKFSDMGYRVIGVDFSKYATLDEIKKRNLSRPGYKFVPEEAIETIHERILDLDIPTWVDVITPDEFKDNFNNIKMNFDHLDSLTFIGDIHGCDDELEVIQNSLAIDGQEILTNDGVVFLGDYFDRGPKIVEVFKRLQFISEHRQTWFLKGNHEEPLEHYKEFMQHMTKHIQSYIIYESTTVQNRKEYLLNELDINSNLVVNLSGYGDAWYSKILGWYNNNLGTAPGLKQAEKNIEILSQELSEYQAKYPEVNNISWSIIQDFSSKSYKQLDQLVQDLEKYPLGKEWISNCIMSFKSPAELLSSPEGFSKLKKTSLRACKLFLLSDIKYTEITSFVKQCQQLFYGDFGGKTFLATHGGIPDLPTTATPTSTIIRGSGGYDDAQETDTTFHRLNPDVISIHGHRNLTNIPIWSTPGTINLNGDVDLGLRAISFYNGSHEGIEVNPRPATKEYYKSAQLQKAKKFGAKKLSLEEQSSGLLDIFQKHTHVDIKQLPDNIVAVNFTRKAFEHGVWDSITLKARDLFVSNTPHRESEILARGYDKFFNLGERNGFDSRDVREMAFPLKAWEKANGYLGILSVDNRDPKNPKWIIASKSTTTGDFAKHFQRMIASKLTPALESDLITLDSTILFEVIDPIFDPHMEEYEYQELVVLDVIKNSLNLEFESEGVRRRLISLFGETDIPIREKKLIAVCETYNEYYSLIKKEASRRLLSNGGNEGLVFEDSSPEPLLFKTKTPWYTFWKRQRSTMHKIYSILTRVSTRMGTDFDGKLPKSDSIRLKAKLYTADEIKVFKYMVELAEKDLTQFKSLNIIDIRNGYLKQYPDV